CSPWPNSSNRYSQRSKRRTSSRNSCLFMGRNPCARLEIVIDGYLPVRYALFVPLLRVPLDRRACGLAQGRDCIRDVAESLTCVPGVASNVELHNAIFRE